MKRVFIFFIFLLCSCRGDNQVVQRLEIEKISLNTKENLAVLLIDMQTDFIRDFELKERERIVKNQLEVIKLCKQKRIPLVVIEYNGYGEVIKDLERELSGELIYHINKDQNDAFYNPRLNKLLSGMEIKTVFLMGINAGACVLDTAEGALENGYQVVTSFSVLSDIDDDYLFSSLFWFEENARLVESFSF